MAKGASAQFDSLCRERQAEEKTKMQAVSSRAGALQAQAQYEEEARLAELGLAADHERLYEAGMPIFPFPRSLFP